MACFTGNETIQSDRSAGCAVFIKCTHYYTWKNCVALTSICAKWCGLLIKTMLNINWEFWCGFMRSRFRFVSFVHGQMFTKGVRNFFNKSCFFFILTYIHTRSRILRQPKFYFYLFIFMLYIFLSLHCNMHSFVLIIQIFQTMEAFKFQDLVILIKNYSVC